MADTADKAKADEERAAKAAAKEQEREQKAKAAAEAKAKREAEKAEAKAQRDQERLVALAEKEGVSLDGLKGTGENGVVTPADVRAAGKAKRAEERANRPKKAALTLSQRRAMLKLGDGPIVPKTAFNALPLEYLVSVGLAETKSVKVDGPEVEVKDKDGNVTGTKPGPKVEATQYQLTDTGKARVAEVNPKWRDWKPAATESTPVEETATA